MTRGSSSIRRSNAASSLRKPITTSRDSATTAIVATLQGSAGGTTNVHRVVIDTAANTFRIYLTANTTGNVKVAWFAFG